MIQYDDLPEDVLIKAIEENPHVIRFVTNKTKLLCMTAVKKDGHTLIYMSPTTSDVCLEALKQNGEALGYIINQSLEMCLTAIKQNKKAFKHIRGKVKYSDALKKALIDLGYFDLLENLK